MAKLKFARPSLLLLRRTRGNDSPPCPSGKRPSLIDAVTPLCWNGLAEAKKCQEK